MLTLGGGTTTAALKTASVLHTGMTVVAGNSQVYSLDAGSGVSGMLSDSGRMSILRARVLADARDLRMVFGNFITQQTVPNELPANSPIQVRASIQYPAGAFRYVSTSTAFASGTAYAAADMVTYGGKTFYSLQSSNTNHTPGVTGSEAWWQESVTYQATFNGRADGLVDPGNIRMTDLAGFDVVKGTYLKIKVRVQPCTTTGVPVNDASVAVAAWSSATTYTAGQVVYDAGRFYQALQGSTNSQPVAAGNTTWLPLVYPGGPTAYTTAGVQPDWLAVSAAGSGTPTDYTTSDPTAASAASALGYGPIAVLGRATGGVNGSPNLLIIDGDSIAFGAQDGQVDLNIPGGYLVRALQTAGWAPYLRQAKVGDTLRNRYNDGGYLRNGSGNRLVVAGGATHVIVEHATNEIGTSTLLQVQTHSLAAWNFYAGRRLRCWQCTILPQTTSTDSWATVANQTAKTNFGTGSVWDQYNIWLRAGAPLDPTLLTPVVTGTSGALVSGQTGHPLTGVIDAAAAITATGGVWIAGSLTADGTHPNSTGYTTIAASINLAPVLATPAMTAA